MIRSILMVGLLASLSIHTAQAQIKNMQSVTAEIQGNCGMCKKTIETAGNEKNISKVVWDADSKQAQISFDSLKTSEEKILQKIARAGYDNEAFLAPEETYANLHECCKYERVFVPAPKGNIQATSEHKGHEQSNTTSQASVFTPVFQQYLGLKDALVTSNANQAGQQAKALAKAIAQADMKKMGKQEHDAWMKTYKDLEKVANAIGAEKSIEKQRNRFMNLSDKFYALAKLVKLDKQLYLQHCPMANQNKGAHWLSAEEDVKNPYYGNKMLTCGSVKEKI